LASAFEGRLEQLKLRKAVIAGNDGLRERELRKMERIVERSPRHSGGAVSILRAEP